jgi:hypothetical protein
MKTRGATSILFALALALAMIVPVARADDRDQATQLTFDQPVQIPGNVVLPPGTYWFKVSDNTLDRNVVRVFDSNWSIIATTIAVPTLRPEATNHTMLKLAVRTGEVVLSGDGNGARIPVLHPDGTTDLGRQRDHRDGRTSTSRNADREQLVLSEPSNRTTRITPTSRRWHKLPPAILFGGRSFGADRAKLGIP